MYLNGRTCILGGSSDCGPADHRILNLRDSAFSYYSYVTALTISTTSLADAGTYSCVFINRHGRGIQQTESAVLNVIGNLLVELLHDIRAVSVCVILRFPVSATLFLTTA